MGVWRTLQHVILPAKNHEGVQFCSAGKATKIWENKDISPVPNSFGSRAKSPGTPPCSGSTDAQASQKWPFPGLCVRMGLRDQEGVSISQGGVREGEMSP